MKKVNFKKFEAYTGISKQKKVTGDARKDFADLIYQHTIGIEASPLLLGSIIARNRLRSREKRNNLS